MGRAQGQPHRSDRFATVMGARRGLGQDSDLTSATPTLNARRDLNQLLQGVADGEMSESLRLLRVHRASPAPLLHALATAVRDQLIAEQYASRVLSAADFADLVSCDGNADHILLDSDDNHTLHLWPDGMTATPRPRAGDAPTRTSCGIPVKDRRFERVPRGWWASRGTTTYAQCAGCAAGAHLYPETTERHGDSAFPAHLEPHFRQRLETDFGHELDRIAASKMRLDKLDRVRVNAGRVFTAALEAHAFERLQAGGDALLDRMLGTDGPAGDPDLRGALDRLKFEDWTSLARPLIARSHRPPGVPSARWLARRDKQADRYHRALIAELHRAGASDSEEIPAGHAHASQ